MSSHKSKKARTEETIRKHSTNLRTCATCHRDISDEIYVKCSRCAGFNQCLECFSVGNEALHHLRTHPFVILEPILQPIYQEGWTAEQEIILLQAIQSCGLGNWNEIADVLKTKSAVECEAHYTSTFLNTPNAPFPPEEILPEAPLPPPPTYDTSPTESRPSIAHEKNLQLRGKKERTTPAEFAGWMPRRNEFEVEFHNDAEKDISGITFNDETDTEATFAEKIRALRIYNDKLEDRHRHTKVAIEYDILEHEFRSFGAQNKEEKEIEEAVMPLAQVLDRKTLTHFVKMTEKELHLKKDMEMLQSWRQNGIVTRDEGLFFKQLENIISEDKLTPVAVDKWNRDVQHYAESPDFRASLDRQLLTNEENQLCKSIGIPLIPF